MLVLFWRILHRRNKKVHENSLLSIELTVNWSLDYLETYQKANGNVVAKAIQPMSNTSKNMNMKWCKSPDGIVKADVNAAIDVARRLAGFGVVVRDTQGQTLALAVWSSTATFSPEFVETIAILNSLRLCRQLDYSSIIIEFDCKSMLNEINNRISLDSSLGLVIQDIIVI
ncbi:uncharacterized protein LOC133780311 [Humulus lupulus]|uniref:uncharacterized protein LOC133780311 n=1 Tax=Humulus lupulus TaxID=3486 RepID=UPI002B402886|nr:uncharacterized protein LOC133780311 [Humulus lupulus]